MGVPPVWNLAVLQASVFKRARRPFPLFISSHEQMTSVSNHSGMVPSWPKGGIISWTLRIVLAAIFLYAGIVKSTASEQFLIALAPFTFLPEALLVPISFWLPVAEVLIGLLLLIPPTHKLGAGLALALLLIFIAVLAWALSQGIIVSCSCFGEDDAPSAWKMVVAIFRDLLLAAAALWLLLQKTGFQFIQKKSIDRAEGFA